MKKIISSYESSAPRVEVVPMVNKTPLEERTFSFGRSYCFGSVITPDTEGSCILLGNGLVLTALHVVFDLKKHGELISKPFASQSTVEQYYSPNNQIKLQFVKSDVVYTVPVSEIVKDGRCFLYHQRVDSSFGWDFALLQPSVDLLAFLGPGLGFDTTDYTWGRLLLTDNPKNTFFISRPIVDEINAEFTQSFIRGNPASLPPGPLSLHGDDPTPKLPSYSGGAVLNERGQIYQIKNQRNFSLYAKDILSFISRRLPEDTRRLESYYLTAILHWGLHLIGKEKPKPKPDKSQFHSIPYDKFKNAVGEMSLYSWNLTNDDRTIKVWEICDTERWDFHLSACLNPTGHHVTKFHFTLRDRSVGKGRSGFAWYEIEGHDKTATLKERSDAGETDVFEDTSLNQEVRDEVDKIDTYASALLTLAISYL